MNAVPGRLGLKPELRDETLFMRQRPLSKEERLSMINYTIENDKNGFWVPIDKSEYNNPYTMVSKKPDKDGWVYMRPAVDGRFLNEKCNLIHADMPTYEDFDDFLSSEDILMTTADFKNCFDTYPLHEDDQTLQFETQCRGVYNRFISRVEHQMYQHFC
jgi:hypothetical protein